MTTVNATITSKNQLTLPVKLVRKYKLDINRSVTITDHNGSIIIKPTPSLSEKLQHLWDEFEASHPDFPSLSDDDIHTEAQEAFKHKPL